MNLTARTLLGAALATFIAFHFLVFYDLSPFLDPHRGWRLWEQVWASFVSPNFDDPWELIALSSFLAASLLTVASPFAFSLLANSRWMWWLAVIASGMALTGLGSMLVTYYFDPDEFDRTGPGLFCLLATLVLNFLGLLFIRRESPAISPPP